MRSLGRVDEVCIDELHRPIGHIDRSVTSIDRVASIGSRRSIASIDRIDQSTSSIDPIDQSTSAIDWIDPSTSAIDRIDPSTSAIDWIDRIHRSIGSISFIDRSHRSVDVSNNRCGSIASNTIDRINEVARTRQNPSPGTTDSTASTPPQRAVSVRVGILARFVL